MRKGLILVLCAFLLILFNINIGKAGLWDLPSKYLDRVYELFPEAKPPLEVKYISHITIPSRGFEIFNYEVVSNGEKVGVVTRIRSLYKEGPSKWIDILVRYKNGKVYKIANLHTPGPNQPYSFDPIYMFYEGKDPTSLQIPMLIISSGLGAGVRLSKMKPSVPRPPKGHVLDLRNKILTPGAKLPNLKVTDIYGRVFDTEKYMNKKLVFIFTDIQCSLCSQMIKATKEFLKKFAPGEDVTIVYIVGAKPKEAVNYAKMLGLNDGFVIADTYDQLHKLFKIPFKPYALMFDSGVLKYNAIWQGKEKYMGILYVFLKGNE